MFYSKLVLPFLFLVSLQVYAQKDVSHIRSIISKEETWEPGIIIYHQHVVDSFFYQNGTKKEIVESIIKSRGSKVFDSIPINTREVWNINENLVFKEFFKKGQIHKVKSFYPDHLNIIKNGSFEIHDEIPILDSYQRWWKVIGLNPVLKETKIQLIDSLLFKGDTIRKISKLTYLDSWHLNLEEEMHITKNKMTLDSFIVMKKRGGNNQSIKQGINRNYEVKTPGWVNAKNNNIQVFDLKNEAPYYPFWRHNLLKVDVVPVSGISCTRLKTKEPAILENTTIFQNTRFLTASLNTWIEKNNHYYLEFWVWVWPGTQKDEYGELSICFSKETIGKDNFKLFNNKRINVKPLQEIEPYTWTRIHFSFKAKEDACFMTIGNFNDNWNREPHRSRIASGNGDPKGHSLTYPFSSECYLDNFILARDNYRDGVDPLFHINDEQSDSLDSKPVLVFNGNKIKENEAIMLKNIYFDFNSSELLSTSYAEINSLIKLLNEHKDINLKISGHTDNFGTKDFNMKLSEQRAKAVCDYIIEMGILPERLSWQGFGSQMTIADNNTEEGKQKNRRVEFRIINKKKDNK